MNTSIADIRRDYKMASLSEEDAASNALEQFGQWWKDAASSEIDEVNAMCLSTIDADNNPDARIVLLKDFDERGFMFFTNYRSAKGRQLTAHPNASLVFFWKELERQVRIKGTVEKLSAEESDAYFSTRPQGSKLGAWASPQSDVLQNRTTLDQLLQEVTQRFANETNVPRPPHWGGFLLRPVSVEFWQGRSSRLHDRLLYTLQQNSSWKIERLAP